MMTRTDDEDLLAQVYDRLRAIADRHLQGERKGHTLQPTALVHEAWFNLGDRLEALRDEPARFFAAAAEAMRRILIDHARRRGAQKRGGGAQRISLDLIELASTASVDELLAIEQAIVALAALDSRGAEVVRLRFYAGLDEQQVADVLAVSVRTVRRDWTFARAFLYRQLAGATND